MRAARLASRAASCRRAGPGSLLQRDGCSRTGRGVVVVTARAMASTADAADLAARAAALVPTLEGRRGRERERGGGEWVSLSSLYTNQTPPFLLPPSASARKGDAGRVAVVGGCREYTGAPWFAAMAALKVCEGGKRV